MKQHNETWDEYSARLTSTTQETLSEFFNRMENETMEETTNIEISNMTDREIRLRCMELAVEDSRGRYKTCDLIKYADEMADFVLDQETISDEEEEMLTRAKGLVPHSIVLDEGMTVTPIQRYESITDGSYPLHWEEGTPIKKVQDTLNIPGITEIKFGTRTWWRKKS